MEEFLTTLHCGINFTRESSNGEGTFDMPCIMSLLLIGFLCPGRNADDFLSNK